MKKKLVRLERIDNNLQITKETHSGFLYRLQLSLLLALREKGILSIMQYRYAQEQLYQQYRSWQPSC